MNPTWLLLATALTSPEDVGFEAAVDVTLRVIDVRVTDKQDRFVPDLERDDFEIYENGELRQIQTFEQVRYVKPGADTAPGMTSIGFTSPPRRFLFILDRTHQGQQTVFRKVRERMAEFVRREMVPGDLAAVAQYSQQKTVVKDFSADPETVIANIYGGDLDDDGELKNFILEAPSDQWDPVRSPFMAAVAAASGLDVQMGLGEKLERFFTGRELERFFVFLTDLGRGLDVMPGPKTVVLASGGFISEAVTRSRDELYDRGVEAMASLAGSGAQLYIMDTTGLLALDARPGANQALARSWRDSLQWLAEKSGGIVYHNSNNYKRAFEVVARRESGYYSIGFQVPDRRDERAHQIEVKLKRDGLRLSYPSSYLAPPEPGSGNETVNRVQLIKLATRRTRSDELDLGLAVVPLPRADGPGVLRIGLELPPREAEVDVHVQTESWRGGFRSAYGRLPPAARSYEIRLPAEPGPLTVAVTVRDRDDGRVGGAFQDLELPTPDETLAVALWAGEDASGVPQPASADASGRLELWLDLYATAAPQQGWQAPELKRAWSVSGGEIEELEHHWLAANGHARLALALDVSALPPAEHELVLELADADGNARSLRLGFDRPAPPRPEPDTGS